MHLIYTEQREKPDYYEIYKRSIGTIVTKTKTEDYEDIETTVKKLIFTTVKLLNLDVTEKNLTADSRFDLYCLVLDLMSILRPGELVTLFPIEKTYDGKRWGTKDYFSSMTAINALPQDQPIGDGVKKLLWALMNPDIDDFMVGLMCTMSDIRREQGQPGLMEEFAAKNNIPVYHLHKDPVTGKEFMINSQTGRSSRVRRKTPRYLRAVKH